MKYKSFLIYGYGYHAKKNIIPNLNKINKLQIFIKNRESVFKQFDNNFLVKSKKKIFDVIWICTQTKYHQKTLNEILEKYKFKKIIVEKPCSIKNSQLNSNFLIEGSMFIHHKGWDKVNKIIHKSLVNKLKIKFIVPKDHFKNLKLSNIAKNVFLDVGYYPLAALFFINKNIDIDEIKFSDYSKGLITYKYKNNDLVFGLGNYKNEIEIFTKNKKYLFNFVFSKPLNIILMQEKDLLKNKKRLLRLTDKNHFINQVLDIDNFILLEKKKEIAVNFKKFYLKNLNIIKSFSYDDI